jgi:hypothetical protein
MMTGFDAAAGHAAQRGDVAAPAVMAKATKKSTRERGSSVDDLIDYQIFVEQPGEEIVGIARARLRERGLLHGLRAVGEGVPPRRRRLRAAEIPNGAKLPHDYFRRTSRASSRGRRWIPTPTAGTGRWRRGNRQEKAQGVVLHERWRMEVEIEHDAIRYEGPAHHPEGRAGRAASGALREPANPGPLESLGGRARHPEGLPDDRRDQAPRLA